MSEFRTIDDIDPDSRVLVRLDLNSPVEDGRPADNRRFARHAGTVRELSAAGHRVVCLAHQGRPGRETFISLRKHAELLSEHVGRPVQFVPDTVGDAAIDSIRRLEPGEILLLENTRMAADELPEKSPAEHAKSEFVETLSQEFDVYVNDAYSASHRRHASLVGFPPVLPSYAGRVMVAEYEANTAITSRTFDGAVTMILGGTKARDVVDVMEAIGDRVDTFCLGGIAGELFLRAAGYDVGFDLEDDGLFDDQWADTESTIRSILEARREDILLPIDLAGDDGGERREIDVEDIEQKRTPYFDIGGRTTGRYRGRIRESGAVFVKGALGVFEDERFANGTVGVLEAIAETDCFSVVGGGDTSRAIDLYGLDEDEFSHVSIAGGAYIRALTGKPLPAIDLLKKTKN